MPDSIEPVTAVHEHSGGQPAPEIPHAVRAAFVGDTVTLSNTAKATLLQQDGETVAEIAATLGLTISQVRNDLDLTPPPDLTYHR